MKKYLLGGICLLWMAIVLMFPACSSDEIVEPEPDPGPEIPAGTVPIPASTQRSGDAEAGRWYWLNGDYVDSGVPFDLFTATSASGENLLGRSGDNVDVPYNFTAVDAANGVRVVVANCLQCHAQQLNGELIVGLGNSMTDFTTDQSSTISLADAALQLLYGSNSPEWAAYSPFRESIIASAAEIVTEVKGVNPAGKLAVVLTAHRNQNDLTWIDDPVYPIPPEVIPEDVPPLWLIKKKHALYYNASGKGDFARLIMASSALTMEDSLKAREVDQRFVDVVAYLKTLEAPVYPEATDAAKVDRGKSLFESNCARCHGTYGAAETYPNLLVTLDEIQTDSLLVFGNFAFGDFQDWYTNSWFAQEPNAAQFTPELGYIAPPLDGIWATAPYLHNGSVPTLEDLLNSPERPTFWRRSFSSFALDYEKMGWQYTRESAGGNVEIYDTTLPGYGNGGHTYGDSYTDEQRSDLIEYLKTL
ncbi:MAG: c-type cytochrome [Bacteroidota bacterium]